MGERVILMEFTDGEWRARNFYKKVGWRDKNEPIRSVTLLVHTCDNRKRLVTVSSSAHASDDCPVSMMKLLRVPACSELVRGEEVCFSSAMERLTTLTISLLQSQMCHT